MRVQAPHVTFHATYDLSTGSPRNKTTKRNRIRENPKEKPKTRGREQNPDSNFFQFIVRVVPRVSQKHPVQQKRNAAWELRHCMLWLKEGRGRKPGGARIFFARTHSHLHLFKLMLKMIQHDDGRSETKTTFKTRYWWYAGTFISHARTHSNLHIVRLMLKMNCSKRPKRSKRKRFQDKIPVVCWYI